MLCFSWLEDDTTEVYPYFVLFSLVLLGLGDFFDETCLFSIKPNKSCLSMYLTKVTSWSYLSTVYYREESCVTVGRSGIKTLTFMV